MNRFLLAALLGLVGVPTLACRTETPVDAEVGTATAREDVAESQWQVAVSVKGPRGDEVKGARFILDSMGIAPPTELPVLSYGEDSTRVSIPDELATILAEGIERLSVRSKFKFTPVLCVTHNDFGPARVGLPIGETAVQVSLTEPAYLTVEFSGGATSSSPYPLTLEWGRQGEPGNRIELPMPMATGQTYRRDLGVMAPGPCAFRCYREVGGEDSERDQCFLISEANLSAGENVMVLPIPKFRNLDVKLHGGVGTELTLKPVTTQQGVETWDVGVCDEEGVAHFFGILNGTYELSAKRQTAESSFNVRLPDVVVNSELSEMTISEFALCSFVVEAENGAGVKLELRRVGDRPDSFRTMRFNRKSVCDAKGRAFFTDVPPGVYKLVTTPGTGFNVLQVLAEELEVHAGLEVFSAVVPKLYDFKVTIEDDRFAPRRADMNLLTLKPADGSLDRTYRDDGKVDSEGNVCFTQIPAGDYLLSMKTYTEEWSYQSHPVTVPTRDLSIEFESLFALTPLDFSIQIVGGPAELEISLQLEPFRTDAEVKADGMPELGAAMPGEFDTDNRAFFRATQLGSYLMTVGPPNGPKKTAWISLPPTEQSFNWSDL